MIKYSSGIWYSHIQKKGRLMQKQSLSNKATPANAQERMRHLYGIF